MDRQWEQVYDFHEKFGAPVSDRPKLVGVERVQARSKWMLEEVGEFLSARTVVDQADAMIDLIYFALGTLVEMGVKPEGLFDIVHGANMSKLWEDGKPHYNADGKVIKSPGWEDPYPKLEKAIREMGK